MCRKSREGVVMPQKSEPTEYTSGDAELFLAERMLTEQADVITSVGEKEEWMESGGGVVASGGLGDTPTLKSKALGILRGENAIEWLRAMIASQLIP
ncbi:hypothetical protein C5167_028241 [Papaver somniferum]|nr:hypothetical protein C5167_028241 [Papaver somniferum]